MSIGTKRRRYDGGAQAFVDVGMQWASYIVALGALLGIVTGTMIGLLAVARSICALGREHFIWPIFGWVRAPRSRPCLADTSTARQAACLGRWAVHSIQMRRQ